MFDILLGTKFSSKCKHAIKRIATRIETIRRKKQAMLRFLRKDVADLIANGLEINAFGRIEALIVETNHASCYDMIEHYCEYIKGQLPTLQKRECPNVNEVMEAVATLIYAAARFSDLPELCDLRRIFTERYGSDVEASTSAEFVEKMQKKSFSTNKKLRLMQDIAQEFSVTWDFKAFEQKISTPSASVLQDQPKKETPMSISNQINKPLPQSTTKFEAALGRNQPRKGTTCHPLPASNARKEADKGKFEATLGRDQHPRNGTPTRNEPLPTSNARKEADSDVLIDKVPYKEKFEANPRSTSQKKIQSEPRVIHVVSSFSNGQTHDHSERTRKVIATETENVEPISTNAAPPLYFKPKDSQKDAQRKESIASPREVVGIDRSASMVPPYTKPRFDAEEHHSNRYAYDGSLRAAEDPMDQERQPVTRVNSNGRPFNMIPPYVKPKANNLQADAWSGVGDLKDHRKDEMPEPISVRRRQAKPQAFREIETAIDDSSLVGRTPSRRRRHGGQPSPVIHDDDQNEGEKRRHREPKQAVWDDERHGGRSSCHGSRRNTDAIYDKYCDEEVVMDQLLMHYSTKGTDNKYGKTRARTRAPPAEIVLEQQSDVKLYHRAASSPIKPIRLAEVFEGPTRSALRGA